MTSQYLGVTPPISTAGPSESDIKLTHDLETCLAAHGMFEPESEARKREIVLGKLNMLVKKFVKKVCMKQGIPEREASRAGGKIFTFGSYRLGVHSSGADIDTLCVVPQNVERTEFFSTFDEMLSNQSEVTELTSVPDAYVPVIKLNFDGIPIDLLFARLTLSSIPDNLDLLDNALLRNMDQKCVRSINGSRVADQIVRLVPNLDTFRLALRSIKLWAKKRAIYSNVMGYLGGVAWALMVARICQLYPNYAASSIVSRFFTVYYKWSWPCPISLKTIEDGPDVWNPRNNHHLMPVITPAYPAMCSTHNVSNSTLKVMTLEFLRGGNMCLDIEQGRATWDDLFAKSDFFYRYKTYLRVIVGATTEEFKRLWLGFVESKLRVLVMKLEMIQGIESSPPYPYGFDSTVTGTSLESLYNSQGGNNVSVLDELSDSKKYLCTSYYIGLEVKLKSSDASMAPKQLSVERPVSEFKRMVLPWEKFLPTEMDISIQAIKRGDLPDEVYEGMVRPSSVKRKKSSKSAANASKSKLSESNSELDDKVDTPTSSSRSKIELENGSKDVETDPTATVESASSIKEGKVVVDDDDAQKSKNPVQENILDKSLETSSVLELRPLSMSNDHFLEDSSTSKKKPSLKLIQ